jgi:hypothetical protein
VEQFKYLGTVMNQISIHKEIKEHIQVRENLLSFGAESFVFQFSAWKYKDKIHRTVILSVILCERKTVGHIEGGTLVEGFQE